MSNASCSLAGMQPGCLLLAVKELHGLAAMHVQAALLLVSRLFSRPGKRASQARRQAGKPAVPARL